MTRNLAVMHQYRSDRPGCEVDFTSKCDSVVHEERRPQSCLSCTIKDRFPFAARLHSIFTGRVFEDPQVRMKSHYRLQTFVQFSSASYVFSKSHHVAGQGADALV